MSETIEATHAAPIEEPAPKRKGQTPEYMRELTRKRMEMAKTDPSKKGGRRRTKFTRAEAEAKALERLMPKALKVLEEQLDSRDERVKQSAAVKVLEYVKGKPTQNINQRTDQVTRIVYESAAWDGTVIDHAAIEEADLLALPEAPEEPATTAEP